ncbi:MAG: ADP-ribosylglycohydrolase family protein [Saprospiraceae bacterium]|nr:ADP-ribosylglycohydrolase family protein [Saprospiraceae bacterium]
MILFLDCTNEASGSFPIPLTQEIGDFNFPDLSKEDYHDKILGFLVGSAIGDAMGSPVEMWSQDQIADRYGFVDRLIPNSRVASAEGPWVSNMQAGTGTDDTRWKFLFGQFLLNQIDRSLSPKAFAQYVDEQFDILKSTLERTGNLESDKLEANVKYLQWLQEWAIVASAYNTGNIDTYSERLAKFYGGEMACAGLLYAPMIGILFPGDPQNAYLQAWNNSLFDIGYAKDLTALSAAMVAVGMTTKSMDSVLNIHRFVDPKNYADSRLLGRIGYQIHEDALSAQRTQMDSLHQGAVPSYFGNDSTRYAKMLATFEQMNPNLKAIPFHADEIYRITVYALAYAQDNFLDAMVFITNYGRDNDTVGAVAGGILGTFLGFRKLPENMGKKVLDAHRDLLNIDLERLAGALADKYYPESN